MSFSGKDYKRFNGKVDPGQARDGVITLQPIAVHRADVIVKGIVLCPNGNPVDGATVQITENLSRYVSASTDEQGRFELTVFELPVDVVAGKNIPPGGSHLGKVTVTDKDKDVTITIRAADDKDTFLPVVKPGKSP